MTKKRIFLLTILLLIPVLAFADGWVLKRSTGAVDDQATASAGGWQAKPNAAGKTYIKIAPSVTESGAAITGLNKPSGSTENPAKLSLYSYGTNGAALIAALNVTAAGTVYECSACYGLMGISHDSLSGQGTGTGFKINALQWE